MSVMPGGMHDKNYVCTMYHRLTTSEREARLQLYLKHENGRTLRAWLNGNAVFYETFVSMSVKQNLFVSVIVHKCLMLIDVEYTTFKTFVTQMSNYLFVISFQLMFKVKHCVIV